MRDLAKTAIERGQAQSVTEDNRKVVLVVSDIRKAVADELRLPIERVAKPATVRRIMVAAGMQEPASRIVRNHKHEYVVRLPAPLVREQHCYFAGGEVCGAVQAS